MSLLCVTLGCAEQTDPAAATTATTATISAPVASQKRESFVVVEPESLQGEAAVSASLSIRHAYSHAHAKVLADSVRVTVTEVLVNDSETETKTSFSFPLPNDATVTGFADFRDGRRVEASLGNREAARKAFDAAETAGKHAGLTEADGPMGFHMDLTPLAPHESRRVELVYLQSIRPLGAERSFVYPAGRTIADPATISELDFELTAGRPIHELDCENQRDAHIVHDDATHARVSLDGTGGTKKSDVVVRWTEASDPVELALRGARIKEGDAGYVEARLSFTRDPAPEHASPRTFVFVVDTSLSMAGQAIERAKSLVRSVSVGLSGQDKIALVSFDDDVRSWSAALPAVATNKQRLQDELSSLRAAGGSNLDAAIDRAAELLAGSVNPILVMATDGQPTVGEHLDELSPASAPAAFQAVDVRVALFNYPSCQKVLGPLFPRLSVEYVPNGDAGDSKVKRLAALAAAPRIENVKWTVSGLLPGTQRGLLPESVLLGDSVRVAGRAEGAVTVHVTGTLHGRPIALEKRIGSPSIDPVDPLPVEWARLSIAELELAYDEKPDPATRDRITALATDFHLVSRFTSLVATEDSMTPDRVMPGDPEIFINAPRGATSVRAILPWGEVVECEWRDDEERWYGRFLVPRSTADGLYRARVFVEYQGQTRLRTTLLFRVDSKPPEFSLKLVKRDLRWFLEATPIRDVFDSDGNGIRKDRVDVRRLVVRIGSETIPLEQVDDDTWSAELSALPSSAALLGSPAIESEVVATDFALNVSRTRHTLQVTP
jgi:Ca-activated chloride channel family protein